MKKLASTLLAATVGMMLTSCAYNAGGTDLSEVAQRSGLSNVTTGDGTYENYKATGHYTGTEIGIGVGLPFLCKFMELIPGRTNEDLLTDVATTAKNDGANGMINTTPHREFYTGFPFIIIGVYIDSAQGTGIAQE